MIETVIFDLGGVLVGVNPEPSMRKFVDRYPGLDEAHVRRFFGDSETARDYESGRIDTDTFCVQAGDFLGIEIDGAEFEGFWNDVFEPIEPMIDLLQRLKSEYRLVLLSNTNPLHFRSIDARWPFFHHFDDIVLSYEVGAMKPDARIYEAALERCGSPPDACVFFDDRVENVQAAERAGISAYVFEAPDRIRKHDSDAVESIFTFLGVIA